MRQLEGARPAVRRHLRRLGILGLATVAGKVLGLSREFVLAAALGVGILYDHFLALTTAGLVASNAIYLASCQHALATGAAGLAIRRRAAIAVPVLLIGLFPVLSPALDLGRSDFVPYAALCLTPLLAGFAGDQAAELHMRGHGHLPNAMPISSAAFVIVGAIAGAGPGGLSLLVVAGWLADAVLLGVVARLTRSRPLVARQLHSSRISMLALLFPHITVWISVSVDRWAALSFGAGMLSLVYLVNRLCLGPSDIITTTLVPYVLARSDAWRSLQIGSRMVGATVLVGAIALLCYGVVALATERLVILAVAANAPVFILIMWERLLQSLVIVRGKSGDLFAMTILKMCSSVALAISGAMVGSVGIWLMGPLVSTAIGLVFITWRTAAPRPAEGTLA